MAFHKLSSEKYWLESLEQQAKEIRQQNNQAARERLNKMFFIIIVAAGVLGAIMSMPNWLPSVTNYLQYYGLISTPIPPEMLVK